MKYFKSSRLLFAFMLVAALLFGSFAQLAVFAIAPPAACHQSKKEQATR